MIFGYIEASTQKFMQFDGRCAIWNRCFHVRKVQVDVIANYRPGNIPIYSKSLDTVIVSEAQNPIHIVWGSTKGTRHVCIFCFPNGYFYGQTQPVSCLYGNPPLQLCNCAQSSCLARRCEHVANPSRGTAQLSWLPLTDLGDSNMDKAPTKPEHETSGILCEVHRQLHKLLSHTFRPYSQSLHWNLVLKFVTFRKWAVLDIAGLGAKRFK